jgi:hypothetical protein
VRPGRGPPASAQMRLPAATTPRPWVRRDRRAATSGVSSVGSTPCGSARAGRHPPRRCARGAAAPVPPRAPGVGASRCQRLAAASQTSGLRSCRSRRRGRRSRTRGRATRPPPDAREASARDRLPGSRRASANATRQATPPSRPPTTWILWPATAAVAAARPSAATAFARAVHEREDASQRQFGRPRIRLATYTRPPMPRRRRDDRHGQIRQPAPAVVTDRIAVRVRRAAAVGDESTTTTS